MSKKLIPKEILYKGIVGFIYEESNILDKVRKPMAKPTKIIKSKKQKRLEKIRRKEEKIYEFKNYKK